MKIKGGITIRGKICFPFHTGVFFKKNSKHLIVSSGLSQFSLSNLNRFLFLFFIYNDSLPPKYTAFHHLVYVARWSPTLIYF
jgi:hypothetical protein